MEPSRSVLFSKSRLSETTVPLPREGGDSGNRIMYLVKCLRGVDLRAEGQSEGTKRDEMSCVRRIPLFPHPSAHLALLPHVEKALC